MIKITTTEELLSHVNNGKTVVNYSAPGWCIPCQRFLPHYEAADVALDNMTFLYVDVDNCDPDLRANVSSVPTVHAYINGNRFDVTARTGPQLVAQLSAMVLSYNTP